MVAERPRAAAHDLHENRSEPDIGGAAPWIHNSIPAAALITFARMTTRRDPVSDTPTGTVTFLFTDIEGSTRLARSHAASWEALRVRHDVLLRAAVEAHGGCVFKRIGDAFCIAFATASDALAAALAAQRALQEESWSPAPVRVRMGLNTGEAAATRDDDGRVDYVGYVTLARAQQVMSSAHGEQVLLSSSSAQFVRDAPPGT
jgi:class 3 adenylate cyclase